MRQYKLVRFMSYEKMLVREESCTYTASQSALEENVRGRRSRKGRSAVPSKRIGHFPRKTVFRRPKEAEKAELFHRLTVG